MGRKSRKRKEGRRKSKLTSLLVFVLFISACHDVIKNLEICHTEWKKFFGGCNQMKIDLNMCLRAEVSCFSVRTKEVKEEVSLVELV